MSDSVGNEPVTHKEFFNRSWQMAALVVGCSLLVWQILASDVSRARDDIKTLDARVTAISERVTRVEVTLDRMKDDIRDINSKLVLIDQRLADISEKLGAGPMGGPYQPAARRHR